MEAEQQIPRPEHPSPSKDWKRIIKGLLLVFVLLAVGAIAGWYWRDKGAKDTQNAKQAEISSLQSKVTKLEKDVADAKKTTSTSTSTTTTVASTPQSKSPNAATLENIKESITSGNTAALEGYMASTVRVIIAASEGVGDRTPVQAIGDLNYVMAGGTWDFALPAATLAKYQAGDYKQYFPSTAFVGLSSKKYVVSFQFDSNAKINGIFMTISSDLL